MKSILLSHVGKKFERRRESGDKMDETTCNESRDKEKASINNGTEVMPDQTSGMIDITSATVSLLNGGHSI